MGGEYMTVKQAAEQLGLSMARVRFLVVHGQLPGVKLGRDWLLTPEGVRAWGAAEHHAGRPLLPITKRPRRTRKGEGGA